MGIRPRLTNWPPPITSALGEDDVEGGGTFFGSVRRDRPLIRRGGGALPPAEDLAITPATLTCLALVVSHRVACACSTHATLGVTRLQLVSRCFAIASRASTPGHYRCLLLDSLYL